MNGNVVVVIPALARSTRSAAISMKGCKMMNAAKIIPIIATPEPIANNMLFRSVWTKRKNGNPVLRNNRSGTSRNRVTFAAVFQMYVTSTDCSIHSRKVMLNNDKIIPRIIVDPPIIDSVLDDQIMSKVSLKLIKWKYGKGALIKRSLRKK